MNKDHAEKHSMDISHVTSVELPLIVKDVNKAISMLGGKERIRRAVSSQYRPLPIQASSHSVDDRNLELRLRNDPFHHPVQALVNHREKILLKVSIPKANLPKNYHDNPSKYTIRELITKNKNLGNQEHKVEPIAIINKNFSFRGMADFQMSTKNNPRAQKYKTEMLQSNKFEQIKKYQEEELKVEDELADPETFANKDHKLIPPPCFSGIRFPFDYKYQKNPFTVTLRDQNGDSKVIMKFDRKKLFTNTVDYNADTIPQQPLPEIVSKFEWLRTTDLSQEYSEKKLYDCIQFISMLFDVRPIWLRRLIIDVVPENLKTAVKEALPYVSYCFKNGPWRFCNVKLGLDPKENKTNWVHQSENFRVLGIQTNMHNTGPEIRIIPPAIQVAHDKDNITLSERLFFTGSKLPKTVNYQIGDILDLDVLACIRDAMEKNVFFRDTVDPQDGWIRKQVIETIRRIVKYKLHQLKDEEIIDPGKILKIVQTDYTIKDGQKSTIRSGELKEEPEGGLEEPDSSDDGDEDDDNDEMDIDEDENIKQDLDAMDVDQSNNGAETEANVFSRIKQVDEQTAAKLKDLVGLIKQDSLNHI